jgi:hypothetical protein
MPLGFGEGGVMAGLAVMLDRSAQRDFACTTSSNAEVVLEEGADVVVCRITDARAGSAEKTLELGYPAVQEALDLFAARHGWWHDTPEGWATHLLWWRDPAIGIIVRWVDFAPTSLRSEVNWVLNRADGTTQSSEDTPIPPWREAWRYLRYSQTTSDLYDAYRTAYLALESLLSSVHPKTQRRERDWTLAALADLVSLGVDLETFVTPGAPDPVEAFYQEQYKAHRCAQDHAKLSQRRYLPGALEDREQISAALLNLAGLVSHAIPRVDGGGDFGLGMTTLAGIQMYAEISKNMTLHVTEDPLAVDAAATEISPGGLPTSALDTRYLGIVDSVGYDHGWMGERRVRDLASPLVGRTAGTVVDQRPESLGEQVLLIGGNVPSLELSGAELFQYSTTFLWSANGGIKRHYARS